MQVTERERERDITYFTLNVNKSHTGPDKNCVIYKPYPKIVNPVPIWLILASDLPFKFRANANK
jgi:hypothetical protein